MDAYDIEPVVLLVLHQEAQVAQIETELTQPVLLSCTLWQDQADNGHQQEQPVQTISITTNTHIKELHCITSKIYVPVLPREQEV